MKSLSKVLYLARKQPFGCVFASLLSLSIIGALVAAFSYVIFSIWAVSLVKDAIKSSTGFNVTSQNIYVNIFTGKCEIYSMEISNPDIYDMREFTHKESENSTKFLQIKRLSAVISPIELISGKFVFSSFAAEISLLNCVRLNNSTSNLPEFMINFLKISSVKHDAGKPLLSDFDLKISKAQYTDFTTSRDTISWTMDMNFVFKAKDVVDFSKLLKELREAFDKANAPFISNGINTLTSDIL